MPLSDPAFVRRSLLGPTCGVAQPPENAEMGSGNTLLRSELYRMVWTEPISRIAKTYGLSDVGLAKLCHRHDIPRPPRGYWAQRQHGHKPEQIPLPNPKNDPEIPMRERVPDSEVGAETPGDLASPVQTPIIIVSDSLRGCHELVSRANQELEKASTDSDGLLPLPSEGRALDVRTSKACARRALLIFDAPLRECARRGYAVADGPSITIDNHKVTLGISEAVDTTREEAGDDDSDLRGSYSFGHSRFTSKRVLTGRLTLAITDGRPYWASGTRATWRDTEKARLEDQLGKVLLTLMDIAEMARRHEEEQERQRELARQAEARRQEEARKLAERRKLYKAEKARLAQLVQQAENLRRSQMIRELIDAVRQQASQPNPVVPGEDATAWIEWATQQADRFDPLRPNPPSILDEKLDDEEPPGSGRSQWDSNSSSPPPTYWEQRNWWNRNR